MKIKGLFKSFGKKIIFNNFSLDIIDGKKTYIMGESGCGKTTLLRILANLDQKYTGAIESSFNKISYVFQEPRLFPNLTVSQNIAIVGEKTSLSIDHVLSIVELQEEKNSAPSALSGGMKMRLSLARALYHNGDIYLMDEPFSALDQDMKSRIIPKVFKVLEGKTLIIVTHDHEEAKKYADTIISLSSYCEPKSQ